MKYYIRLDDACERMNVDNWDRIEKILDSFNICPLVGVIPHCLDKDMEKYDVDKGFWKKAVNWQHKGWIIALHGFNHVYVTSDGGINPVHNRSEYAGLSLDNQKNKIREGLEILKSHGLNSKVFFTPSHTFDKNTLVALKEETNIRVVSDTVANKRYNLLGITIVPQQSGKVRKLKFKEVTFCYHPNNMSDADFIELESFIKQNRKLFADYSIKETNRHMSLYDKFLSKLYFLRRKK